MTGSLADHNLIRQQLLHRSAAMSHMHQSQLSYSSTCLCIDRHSYHDSCCMLVHYHGLAVVQW